MLTFILALVFICTFNRICSALPTDSPVVVIVVGLLILATVDQLEKNIAEM